MKQGKFITWLSAAVIGIGAAFFSADAGISAAAATGTGTTDSGLTYTYDTETMKATITGYTRSSGNVTIPSTIGSYTVTQIGAKAFWRKYITGISIPQTVTAIGERAFGYSRFQELSLPSSITAISNGAFIGCNYLTSVSLPYVTSLGNGAFQECSVLTSISLPNVVTVGNNALDKCTALTSISLPKVTSVGNSCFYKCTALSSISMPLVKTIGSNAFAMCSALKSIGTPQQLQTVGEQAFMQCSKLDDVVLPVSTTLVGKHAFSDCIGLRTLQVKGPSKLMDNAFHGCTSLHSVELSDSSYTDRAYSAFNYCTSLTTVNGVTVFSCRRDGLNDYYPLLDARVTTAIRNHFRRSYRVYFIDEFCKMLCEYIVAHETDSWMNDALKARQLHDWIVRHCEYETEGDGDSVSDRENHVASSVFVSYALNDRGEGVGESVCEGYAKAFSMLLAAAGIESYTVGSPTHVWNVVNIDGSYYQADVTWDDPISDGDNTHGNPYSTQYDYFLKSSADMDALHGSVHANPVPKTATNHEHPLLSKYTGSAAQCLTLCTQSYWDNNHDGILDGDYDLDGKRFELDFADDLNAYNGFLSFAFCTTPEGTNNRMPEVLYHLHELHWNFWSFLSNSGPTDRIAHAGTNATFNVKLFGDNLTYQWQYYDTASGTWKNAPFAGAQTAQMTVPVTADSYGMMFGCIVYNKNGVAAYSNIGTLYVT